MAKNTTKQTKLENFLKFLEFSLQFKSIKRTIYSVNENHMENDTEHSYQLAIATWYVIETEKLKLDTNLAIKYALIHDLEEAIFGDINIFDTKARANKEKKEEMARKKIASMFPRWKEYKKLSINYKNLNDDESRLVNGIDKILPVLNIYSNKGKDWKEQKLTLQMLKENKRKTVSVHSFTNELWKDIEAMLEKNKLSLFDK